MSSDSSSSSLYCSEEVAGLVSSDVDAWISEQCSSLDSLSPPDEDNIAGLIQTEPQHMPESDYLRRCRDRSIDVTARQDSINWILKVQAYYRFSPVTAFLSVNYFDRFLSSNSLPQQNGWPFQLLSVACLSLAAKMEELQVPFLLDLQMFEPKYVFEPKTVQRMELLVMANLNWRLRSVTPFDFLHYFISKLPSSSSLSYELFTRVFSASSDLILNTTRVIDFLGFPPSAIAAAAVFSAAGQSSVCLGEQIQVAESFHEREMVKSCHQLMEEYLIDTCPASRHKDRRAEPVAPPSPVGVLDAAVCGSCDTRSETPGSTSQLEPPSKRLRSSAPDVQQ
ncbi:hypothetical protein UlMin_031140 [Ulmus minor]